MIQAWPIISSRAVGDLGLFRINRDRAQSPRTGAEHDFLVVGMPDWLQVVPVTTDGRLVLVRQYRHASRTIGLEVPGGLFDAGDPDPAGAALRELREETGFGGGKVHELGAFWPQPALLSNRAHFFAAVGVEVQGDLDQDEGEDIEVVLVQPDQTNRLIGDGEIHNAMTVMALGLAAQAGLL